MKQLHTVIKIITPDLMYNNYNDYKMQSAYRIAYRKTLSFKFVLPDEYV